MEGIYQSHFINRKRSIFESFEASTTPISDIETDLDMPDPVCGREPGEEGEGEGEDRPGRPVAQRVHRAERDLGLRHSRTHRIPDTVQYSTVQYNTKYI